MPNLAKPLNILIIEDRPEDAELAVYELRRSGYAPNWQRVDTESEYVAALNENLDVILADYNVPGFSIHRALDLLRQRALDLPVIVVTGSVTEEMLSDLMMNGAVDYLLKDRLARLGPAVSHAVQERELRIEKRKAEQAMRESEERFRRLAENARDVIYRYCFYPTKCFDYVNPIITSITGYTPEDCYADPHLFIDLVHPEDFRPSQQLFFPAEDSSRSPQALRWVRKDGSIIWMEQHNVRVYDGQRLIAIEGIARDITERKEAEELLRTSEIAERTARTFAEALVDIATVLTSNLNPDVVMQGILGNVGRVLPHDFANIMLIEGDQMRIAYSLGYPPEFNDSLKNTQFYIEEIPRYRHMVETGLPYFVPAITDDPSWTNLPGSPSISSYIAVPIQVYGQVIGFLNLYSHTPGFFTALHVDRLKAFANQAAIAIQNAQLYDTLRRYTDLLEDRVDQRTLELRTEKERVEAILHTSSDGIAVAGIDGLIAETNPAFNDLFGMDHAPRSLASLVEPGYVEILTQTVQWVISNRESRRIELVAHGKLQSRFDADIALSPIISSDSVIRGVVCSVRDITEHKQLESDLRETLEREKELSELKSRFISMASHEFRTPLTMISSSAGLLELGLDAVLDTHRKKHFSKIQGAVKQMTQLLEDVLTLGKVESGLLVFTPELTDLEEFCLELIEEIEMSLSRSNAVTFTTRGACGARIIDRSLLRQIVTNLLSNALKYSPQAALIHFELCCEVDQAIFTIKDSGIGIPEENRKRLFDSFYRANNVGRIPGTGLGLAIAKKAVDLHQGTIEFETEIGVGTTFSVVLPIKGAVS